MLKNILVVNITVLLIKCIREIIWSYNRVVRKLYYHLKQDSFRNCHPN